MGQLSFATIVSEGLLLAGDDSLTTRANVWLNAWLRSQYAAWPWPFLQRRATGVSLASGATSLSFGAGAIVTPEVKRILTPVFIYDSAYTTAKRVSVRTLTGGELVEDETVNNPSNNIGAPARFKVRADTSLWGKWLLIPTPVPDRTYLLAIDYIVQPADISTTTDVPLYPNDRTMIQAMKHAALDYLKEADAPAALDVLASMVIDDRVKYGEVTGTNDQLGSLMGLDTGYFR